MAYALGPDEDLETGVRRIWYELIERAVTDLREPERLGLSASVHDARKACFRAAIFSGAVAESSVTARNIPPAANNSAKVLACDSSRLAASRGIAPPR